MNSFLLLSILMGIITSIGIIFVIVFLNKRHHADLQENAKTREALIEKMGEFSQRIEQRFSEQQQTQQESQFTGLKTLHDTLRQGVLDMAQKLDTLTQSTDHRLKEISQEVEKRLSIGFEKTSETFTDIVKRLALIDDAQKKLSDLSGNVISLQEILQDKRSRGAFGEVQLAHLIQNVLPKENYALQYTLSNGLRSDCVLFLPPPTGHIVIDSKFPLENYQRLTDFDSSEETRKHAQAAFRVDIKKHINDIADKYIIPGETSDGALMFIPAEAVFAEIHAHFPDLVELAHHKRIWLASPTTLMAILTTASSVIKDAKTKEHIHLIQIHIRDLSKDFSRFQERMDKLAKHIDQAQEDVRQVHTSAQKISKRFLQIEKTELDSLDSLSKEAETLRLETVDSN